MNDKLNELYAKQNKCEHKNVIKVKSEIMHHYFECTDCNKLASMGSYFRYYDGEQ